MGDWWWHFWHDPMRDNVWSLAGGLLAGLVLIAALWGLNAALDHARTWWRTRRGRP